MILDSNWRTYVIKYVYVCVYTHIYTYDVLDRQTDRPKDRQKDTLKDRQADRHTDRQTWKNSHSLYGPCTRRADPNSYVITYQPTGAGCGGFLISRLPNLCHKRIFDHRRHNKRGVRQSKVCIQAVSGYAQISVHAEEVSLYIYTLYICVCVCVCVFLGM